MTGRILLEAKHGKLTALTTAEELKLVEYLVNRVKMGAGLSAWEM